MNDKVKKTTKRNIRAKGTTNVKGGGITLTFKGALAKKMAANPNAQKYAIGVLKAAFT